MNKQSHVVGFHQQAEEPEKKETKLPEPKVADCVLDAYFLRQTDSGRWTSQDICDNVRDTIQLEPDTVTQYMLAHGYRMEREDDRLVWVKDM